jgi:hypothetical protein
MADPGTANIRKFIIDHFSDDDLTTFCYDYFRDVHEQFTRGMTKGEKVQLLIESCDRRGVLPGLLAALHKERPSQYESQFEAAVSTGETLPEPTVVRRDPRLVFVSYAYEDTQFAHRMAADLEGHGWRVWIAPDSIRPGEKWADAINRGLDECGVFVVALTPVAVRSNWVVTETNVAIELEHKGLLRFIPMQVESCQAPPLWSAYQSISFQSDYATGLAALIAEVERNPPSVKPPRSHAPVKASSWLSKVLAAARHDRRIAAIVGVIAVLVLSSAALFAVQIVKGTQKTGGCPPTIGQQVHIPKGINAWSQPEVTAGGIYRVFNQRTPVYIIGGKRWGIISYGTDVSGWWWEVSETANGESLGWVWEGQIEECQ